MSNCQPIVICQCFCETKTNFNPSKVCTNETFFIRHDYENIPNQFVSCNNEKYNCNSDKVEPKQRFIDPLLPAQKSKFKDKEEKPKK